MNKKIVALLGACCLCFAVESNAIKDWGNQKQQKTEEELKKRVETLFESFFKNSCENEKQKNKDCISQTKKEYKTKHEDEESLEYGVKKAMIGALVIMEEEENSAIKKAENEKRELQKRIEEITNKYLDNL